MALFDSFKKDTKKEEVASPNKKKVSPVAKKERALTPGKARIDQGAKGGERHALILERPRMTEKASLQAGRGAYTFDVHPSATKTAVKRAIKEVYNVEPLKVNIITRKPKKVFVRGTRGVRSGGKKALVYLKKGDKIEFV